MGLIERAQALAEIDEVLAGAATGDGRLICVLGPAGIGKTALLKGALELAAARGFLVLSALGSDLEAGFPFGVVRQLYAGHVNDMTAAIAPLFGRVEEGVPRDVSFQVLDGLYWLVADLAEKAPLLIVVDDGQWADESSGRHLAYLCRRLDGLRILVLLAARSGDKPGLLDDVLRSASGRIELAPLTLLGVSEMVQRALGEAPADGFARACLVQTGGSPLYLGELLREARERGVRPVDEAAGELEGVDADGLAAHVWRRIEAVGADARDVVGVLSVLGSQAQPGRVAQLAGVAAARVADVFHALIVNGVLRAGEPPGFAHPIVGAAVRARLPVGPVDQWHRAAARLLDSEGADRHEVAAHLLQCQPEGDAWAAERLVESARAVLGRGAPDAAALALRRALEESPPRDVRVGLLRDLARAEDAAGDPAAALAHYDEALRIADDPRMRAEIAVTKAQTLALLSRSDDAVSVLEEGLRWLAGSDPELEQRIDAELIVHAFLSTNASSSKKGMDRLKRYKGRLPDGPAAQAILCAMAVAAILTDHPASEAADLAERALRAGGFRSGGFSTEVWSIAAWLLSVTDRADVAKELTERELPAARREGHRREIYVMLGTLAVAAWRRGDLPGAVSWAEASLAVSDEGAHQAWGHGLKALALLDSGDLTGADWALDATSSVHWSESARGSISLYYARAQLRLAQNRLGDAAADVDEIRRRGETVAVFGSLGDIWTPLAAMLAHRAGEAERARGLATDSLKAARRFGAAGALGANLRVMALVGEPETQVELLQEAARVFERSCYRLEYARTLIELGAARRRRGERTAAREPLTEGLDIAYRCGAHADVARAREELRATGARPRRVLRTGAEALTPSEIRVARLAAYGRSNREVAQELYVTVKTVEGTLGKVYSKLGISGRGAREALPDALGPLHEGPSPLIQGSSPVANAAHGAQRSRP
jgi:DNA-binding CsgD family transcriptional regulator